MGHRRGEAAHRLRALGLPLALLAALLLGTALAARPAPAQAVAPIASEPLDRAELSDAPGAVTLAFTREVDAGVAKLIVSGPDGRNVTSGPLIVEGTNVTSRLRDDLPRGTYTVRYRIDASNGDPEGGAYQFSIGNGSFTDLPDKSWSGEDEEPAVLRGTDPNGSEEPDAPSTSLTPGIEVTSEAPTTDPEPPATEPASTVEAPPGPATEAGSGPETEVSATPQEDEGSGSGTPWIVGGVLLLVAVAGAGFGVWRSRRQGSGGHD